MRILKAAVSALRWKMSKFLSRAVRIYGGLFRRGAVSCVGVRITLKVEFQSRSRINLGRCAIYQTVVYRSLVNTTS